MAEAAKKEGDPLEMTQSNSEKIGDVANKMSQKVVSGVSGVTNAVVSGVSNSASAAKKAGSDVISPLVSAVSDTLASGAAVVGEVLANGVDMASDLGGAMKKGAQPVVDKIRDVDEDLGISSTAASVTHSASKKVGKVTKVVGKGVSKVGSKVGAAAGAVDKKLGGHVGKKISKLSEVIANGVKQFTSETVGAEDIRVLILGFDKAGKTTLLNWISEPTKNHAGDYGKTLGYNSKRANYKNSGWHIWDIGGDEEIRGLWPQFYMNIFPYDALVFVVDSTDTWRMNEVKDTLNTILTEYQGPIVICANKQDLESAMSTRKIIEELGLANIRNIPWYCQPTCATTGDGVLITLDWILQNRKKK